MPVAVVIELATRERASPDVPALVEACNRAGADTSCAIADAGQKDPRAGGALAIVAWSPDHREVKVEIALGRDARAEWYSRRLVFRPEDEEKERWRSVGLVIATVVGVAANGGVRGEILPTGERPKGAPPAESPAAPPPSPPITIRPLLPRETPPSPRPLDDASQHRVAIDLLALAGPALDDGTARVGGGARVAANLKGPVFVALDGRFAARPADPLGVSATWLNLGAAVGARVSAASWLHFEGRIGVFGESFHASVDEPKSGAKDAGSRGAVGGLLALDAVVMPAPTFGAFVGLDAPWVPGITQIKVGETKIGTEPVVTALVHAGIRFALF